MEMTIQQMIELLENERDCLQWWSYGDCDMICSECSLKRDDGELYDMYTNVISMLKEQEPKPIKDRFKLPNLNVKFGNCPKCNASLDDRQYPYSCGFCGQAVKWND